MTIRRNLVLGLGKTGVSVARWLVARGEAVTINDSRALPPGHTDIQSLGSNVLTEFGRFDSTLLSGADRIVLSPGVSRREPIVEEALRGGMPVVGDIELFAEQASAPVVAVTGTNGKSTVTTLIAEMIQSSGLTVYAGGNLGEPALDLLQKPTPDFYALELSSYQLESTSRLRLAAATVLNVTPDHMDRYRDLSEYAAAKARIFQHAAVAVTNADDPIVDSMGVGSARQVRFSLRSAAHDYGVDQQWLTIRGERVVAMDELGMPGMHNAANALAALALGEAIGLPRESMVATLRRFSGLAHRMQWVATTNGIRYVNDSKGTNVGATVAAVEDLHDPLVVIAGGDGKGQDFAPLQAAFAGRVRHAVLFGRDAAAVAAAIAGVCSTETVVDMDGAVRAATSVAHPGDIVLLSPACASLDMYRNYAERGDAFVAAVRRLSA
jgi:UDP-N-acetylmuramoylalanine--D-glutamate ligase